MGRDLPSPSPQCLQILEATYGGATGGEGEGGSRHPSLAAGRGGVKARRGAQPRGWQCPIDAPWHPRWWGRDGQGLPIAFVRSPGQGARGAGSGREECPRSMPTMPGLTALKSGCHIPSGQPFTSVYGGLVRLPVNTNTAFNPSAPAVLGCRGQLTPGNAWGTGTGQRHPAAAPVGRRWDVHGTCLSGRGVLGSPGPPTLTPQPSVVALS